MARKRITEEDLLSYRKMADELSEEVAVKYDALEKAKKAAEDVEVRDIGILLLRSDDVDIEKMRLFAANAKRNGFAAEMVDLEKHIVPGAAPTKRVPEWERVMDKAQLGYVMLSEHAERIVVLGAGCSAPIATLIAEQYPVEALVIVGEGPAAKAFTPKRTAAKLASVAKHNLFSIVCPVYCITPEKDDVFKSGSAQLYHSSTRSDDVRLETAPGMSVSGMWTECEHELEKRIFEYMNAL